MLHGREIIEYTSTLCIYQSNVALELGIALIANYLHCCVILLKKDDIQLGQHHYNVILVEPHRNLHFQYKDELNDALCLFETVTHRLWS